MSGKGKGPEKGVNWSKFRENLDNINWGRKLKIELEIGKKYSFLIVVDGKINPEHANEVMELTYIGPYFRNHYEFQDLGGQSFSYSVDEINKYLVESS